MELDVEFNDKKIKTTIYIKMNAHDQLLLSEGVCHQLGMVLYHPDVRVHQAPEVTASPMHQTAAFSDKK